MYEITDDWDHRPCDTLGVALGTRFRLTTHLICLATPSHFEKLDSLEMMEDP